MPARHDILCGALDFLWRPWGSIEIWEDADRPRSCAAPASRRCCVTDHPHLFEAGGENYHTDFNAWDYQRGHESDPWRTRRRSVVAGRAGAPGSRGLAARITTTSRAPGSATRPTSRVRARWPRPRTGSSDDAPTRRALLPVRRRVRPARAVRHARAVGVALRTTPAGTRTAPDLAAVRGRRDGAGDPRRASGAPDPRQLRRQARR